MSAPQKMSSASSALIERLAARLGPKGWSTDPARLAGHLSEWRGRYVGTTPFLALPATVEEASAVVALCAEAGAAITTQGGNTGLVGGQIPAGEILVSLTRMNAIRKISLEDDAMIAEAGVILKTAQEAAAGADRVFPLSLASEGSATIGGLVSTNAGGVHVLRYGMMRDLVLGLEVVLADGRVLPALQTLRKDNTGYDLKQLFIGAEGTLGLVTAAALKLFPRPREHVTAMAALESPAHALALLQHLKSATGALAAFEIMNRICIDLAVENTQNARDPFQDARHPWLALIEFESVREAGLHAGAEEALMGALELGLARDVLVAQTHAQAQSFWMLREELPAGHRNSGAQANHDTCVPVSAVPEFLDAVAAEVGALSPGARICSFGHAGDGNIHVSVLRPTDAADATFAPLVPAIIERVQDAAARLGGSISAEHGIGVSRRGELPRYKSAVALDVMAALKAALDPHRILNPRALI